MPNWNENRVTIHAPTDEVKTWLVAGSDDTYFFNMHRLYPERVPADDPCGDATWDYDWFVENTGSKWPPFILLASSDEGQTTLLDYHTARTPNNLLLECWHRLTGWYMINEYEE